MVRLFVKNLVRGYMNIKKIILIAIGIILLVGLIGRCILYTQGLHVTSWWRSPWKNFAIGGKWFSLHLIGWAYDVVPVNTMLHAARTVWPFKFVVESDHIHLQIL